MLRSEIVFLRNGKETRLADVKPTETLLDYLRLRERKTGTKEGCNEGDCGACTVSLGKIRNGELSYEPVNACILMLGQIDGCDLITVDDLAEDKRLHDVQQAMVDCHASQCGFCTPGFVMSLFSMHHSVHRTSSKIVEQDVMDWIAGNLCRCTGYRPILDAAMKCVPSKPKDALMKRWVETENKLKEMQSGEDLFVGDKVCFFAAPATITSLAKLYQKHPDATILAGATDVGLWVTKQMKHLPKLISIGRAKGFDLIKETKSKLIIGAGAPYREVYAPLAAIDPDIGEVLRRLGSRHVRASGTLGGNIANGSPIGDTPPLLIALGAELELLKGAKARIVQLEDFFLDYGKQDRAKGELVSRIIIPKLKSEEHFRAFKISKRFDQDISALLFAAKFKVKKCKITEARIAFGGMAGTPKRAKLSEAALIGANVLDESSWTKSIAHISSDFEPLSDMRASANYRMKTAQNLLRKALFEIQQEISSDVKTLTRVTGQRNKILVAAQ